jgi:hypothetical protein
MAKVKSLTTYTIQGLPEEMPHAEWQKTACYTYDENGHVLSEISFDNREEVREKTEFKYDAQGNIIEEKQYISENEIQEIRNFQRDVKGRITEVVITYMDDSSSTRKYQWDPEKRIEWIHIINEDQELEGKEFRRYDDKNNLLEEIIYDEEEEIEERRLMSYNDQAYLMSREEYGQNNELQYITKLKYKEENKVVEESTWKANGEMLKENHFTYNAQGELEEHLIKDDAHPEGYIIRFEQNEEKNIRKEEHLLPNGDIEFQSVTTYNEQGLAQESIRFLKRNPGTYNALGKNKFHSTTRFKYEFYAE